MSTLKTENLTPTKRFAKYRVVDEQANFHLSPYTDRLTPAVPGNQNTEVGHWSVLALADIFWKVQSQSLKNALAPFADLSRTGEPYWEPVPSREQSQTSGAFLILVHVVVLDNEIKGCEQEAAGPAGGIANGIVGGRLDAIDDRLNKLARREVLPRAPLVD